MSLENLSFSSKSIPYTPITWNSGDVINAENLNNYEQTLYEHEQYLNYNLMSIESLEASVGEALDTVEQNIQDNVQTFFSEISSCLLNTYLRNNGSDYQYSDKKFPAIFTGEEGTYLGFNIKEEYPINFILDPTISYKEISSISEEMTFKLENLTSEIKNKLPDSLEVYFIGHRRHIEENLILSGKLNSVVIHKSSETGIYTGNGNRASSIGNVVSFDPSTGILTTDVGSRNPSDFNTDYPLNHTETDYNFILTHAILSTKLTGCNILKTFDVENLCNSISYLINDNEIKILGLPVEKTMKYVITNPSTHVSYMNSYSPFYENYLQYVKDNNIHKYVIPSRTVLNQE